MQRLFFTLFFSCITCALTALSIAPKEAEAVGLKIWKNECAGRVDLLVHWKEGEEFLSLGIGHFIWYPGGMAGLFEERFPLFVRYCKDHGVKLIGFLEKYPHCPWKSRQEFLQVEKSPEVEALRQFLLQTKQLQAEFMAERLCQAIPRIIASLPQKKQQAINHKFSQLVNTPAGLYALLDYVNFKGEGVSPKERYAGQGWGLLQVLQEMDDSKELLPAFCQSAKNVLARRVANAPSERNEGRWLKGWCNRIDTYLKP